MRALRQELRDAARPRRSPQREPRDGAGGKTGRDTENVQMHDLQPRERQLFLDKSRSRALALQAVRVHDLPETLQLPLATQFAPRKIASRADVRAENARRREEKVPESRRLPARASDRRHVQEKGRGKKTSGEEEIGKFRRSPGRPENAAHLHGQKTHGSGC